MIRVGHLVEDVGVVDGDADGEPEDLLPRLVGFMENEVPAYIIHNTGNKILELPCLLQCILYCISGRAINTCIIYITDPVWVHGGLETIPGYKVSNTLDRVPTYHRKQAHTHTHAQSYTMDSLEISISLQQTSLDRGRKLLYVCNVNSNLTITNVYWFPQHPLA